MYSLNLHRTTAVILSLLTIFTTSLRIPRHARAGDVIPGSYIVVLNDNATETTFETHNSWVTSTLARRSLMKRRGRRGIGGTKVDYGPENLGVHSKFSFGKSQAYWGEFDPQTIEEVRSRPEVAYIEEDTVVKKQALRLQGNPPWGLARISQKTLIASAYLYDSSAGSGTTAFVLDTGVDVTHPDFDGRATWGTTTAPYATDEDLDGHGTHVAGTIAGKIHGAAKNASIVAVKVLGDDGFGATSNIIMGIQWAVSQAAGKKAIINMSLGGPRSRAMNMAAENAVAKGITIIVAAGNDNQAAGYFSPASASNVITVGATDGKDVRAEFSNYGPEVDIYAPGTSIVSTFPGSDYWPEAFHILDGTSMAAPHVTGVALCLMARENLKTPTEIKNRLLKLSQAVVKEPGPKTTNKMLYNGSGF
ncbi:subtilisin-like protein [Ascodesmis nigricans]|uniref:Subtilisin-like protein n=1 Tax=Ascodesmis nigricans TaxID=341454 RepID=A0A4S2MT52_9PEZI|nr:subtilisin-like protein [Ascodesmis nigricans]